MTLSPRTEGFIRICTEKQQICCNSRDTIGHIQAICMLYALINLAIYVQRRIYIHTVYDILQ